MKRATLLILLVVLFVVVWPVLGQTATTAADYVIRGVGKRSERRSCRAALVIG